MPYREHPHCQPPEENARIWRYMDFTQFISILERRALFFNRSDRFEDPYEGSVPHPVLEMRQQVLEDFSEDWIDELLPRFREITRKYTFLNCWHINEFESAAMWDLYLKTNEGICIQSRFGRLKEALDESDRRILVTKVEYIDYDTEVTSDRDDEFPLGNTISPFTHKRKSFEHENELRAIIQDLPWKEETLPADITKAMLRDEHLTNEENLLNGIYVPVDLGDLIERIYVAPWAPAWIHEVLELVVDTYAIDKEVHASSLEADPVY